MDPERCWVSHPQEWQPLFRRFCAALPGRVRLSAWGQRGGQEVLALTIGDPDRAPFRLLAAVPHGHEPAPTAAAVDVAAQLLTGAHLDGTPADLPVGDILAGALVTLVPDANPQGRARSPVRCWDGTAEDNEALWRHAFGVAADGSRFGRYPEWRFSAHRPRRPGLVYEQIDDDLWVEPNTSRRSAYCRAVDELWAAYGYTHLLDMHQHEGSEAALLPAEFDALPEAVRGRLERWSARLVAAWRSAGGDPRPEPAVPYRGQPRQQFFLDFWSGRCPGMLRLTSEVRNNRREPGGTAPTPLALQFRTALAALQATLTPPFP